MELQPVKPVPGGYTVILEDLGKVLGIYGSSIILPPMQLGFYVTLYSPKGGTITISTPGGNLRSVNNGTGLTSQYQLITVSRLDPFSNDWTAQGL